MKALANSLYKMFIIGLSCYMSVNYGMWWMLLLLLMVFREDEE